MYSLGSTVLSNLCQEHVAYAACQRQTKYTLLDTPGSYQLA